MEQDIDRSNLRQMILSVPEQFADAFAIADAVYVPDDLSRIVVSGLGGSALHVDVLQYYVRDFFAKEGKRSYIEIVQNRSYVLPPESYDNALNIICSYSGNTEEVITAFQEALENNLPCIGVSAGGKIEEMCKENSIAHIKLPIPYEHFQPRMATGYFFATMISILTKMGKIPDQRNELINKVAPTLLKNIKENEERGKIIAQKLIGKTPIIYASDKMRCAAMIWKIKINENGKTPAFWNYFSELNHNEFVGFTNPQGLFHVIMLRDATDYPRNTARYDITADILTKKGVDVEIIDVINTSDPAEKIFTTLSLGDWVSYYLALAYDQDPTPVELVEDFKKKMAEIQ